MTTKEKIKALKEQLDQQLKAIKATTNKINSITTKSY